MISKLNLLIAIISPVMVYAAINESPADYTKATFSALVGIFNLMVYTNAN